MLIGEFSKTKAGVVWSVYPSAPHRQHPLEAVAMAEVHVYPDNDLIDHDTETDDCLCGPETEAVPRDDGSYGWLIVHHSLDGREGRE